MKKIQQGFTLLELIVVIIIIGVLSVTVLPRFMDSKGFEEYSYRGEIITKLRAIQLRAMQEESSRCVALNDKHFGEPSSCDVNTGAFNFSSDYGQDIEDVLEIKVQSNHSVTFSMKTGSVPFSFDKLGRPVGCSGKCEIRITGSEELLVIIESEGFIHAG